MEHAAIPNIQRYNFYHTISCATDGRIQQFLALFSFVKRRLFNEGTKLFSPSLLHYSGKLFI
jgi:hypothetical protein